MYAKILKVAHDGSYAVLCVTVICCLAISALVAWLPYALYRWTSEAEREFNSQAKRRKDHLRLFIEALLWPILPE